MAITAILAFLAAFTGAFFGTLLARTERKIPIITPVKEAIQGEGEIERKKATINAWLYGRKEEGG